MEQRHKGLLVRLHALALSFSSKNNNRKNAQKSEILRELPVD